MAESAGQVEHVQRARRAQLGGCLLERAIQVGQVTGNVVAAEQRAGQDAPSVEDLVGEFAAQHQIVGDALAGFLFGQPVERLDAGRGEREQVVILTAVHGESVAVAGAGRRDRRDRVGDRDVPRQTGALGVGRQRKPGRDCGTG